MAWERRGKKLYLYRSMRVGGKVVRKYIGNDQVAKIAANLMRLRKLERAREASRRRGRRAAVVLFREASHHIDAVVAAQLLIHCVQNHQPPHPFPARRQHDGATP